MGVSFPNGLSKSYSSLIEVEVTFGSNDSNLGLSFRSIANAPAPWVDSPLEPKSYFAISETTAKALLPSASPALIQFALSYKAYEPLTHANFVSTPPHWSNDDSVET